MSDVSHSLVSSIVLKIYRSADIPVYIYIAAKCCQFGPITTLGQLAALRAYTPRWLTALPDWWAPPSAMRERERAVCFMPYTQWEAHSGHDSCVQYFNYRIGTNYKTTKWKFNENRSELFWLIAVSSCCCFSCCCCCWFFKGKSYDGKIVYAYAALFLLLPLLLLFTLSSALITAINW